MEDEFAKIGIKRVMEFFLSYGNPDPIFLPKDKSFEDSTDTLITLSLWLSEEVVAYYVNQCEQSGFTGCLNYYRPVRNIKILWLLFFLEHKILGMEQSFFWE